MCVVHISTRQLCRCSSHLLHLRRWDWQVEALCVYWLPAAVETLQDVWCSDVRRRLVLLRDVKEDFPAVGSRCPALLISCTFTTCRQQPAVQVQLGAFGFSAVLFQFSWSTGWVFSNEDNNVSLLSPCFNVFKTISANWSKKKMCCLFFKSHLNTCLYSGIHLVLKGHINLFPGWRDLRSNWNACSPSLKEPSHDSMQHAHGIETLKKMKIKKNLKSFNIFNGEEEILFGWNN